MSVSKPIFYDGRKFLHNKMGDYLIKKYHKGGKPFEC
nr:MAG TPA: hypothetical protein [Caudoviricetes sp.]